jgi:hypothetical protein
MPQFATAAEIDTSKLPNVADITAANITEYVHQVNGSCKDPDSWFIFPLLRPYPGRP